MFSITPRAAEQIRQAAQESGAHDMALRIAVRQNDEGKPEYGMGFDAPEDDDVERTVEGIRVVSWPNHEKMLAGVTLDYVEIDAGKFQFIFIPPNQEEEEAE